MSELKEIGTKMVNEYASKAGLFNRDYEFLFSDDAVNKLVFALGRPVILKPDEVEKPPRDIPIPTIKGYTINCLSGKVIMNREDAMKISLLLQATRCYDSKYISYDTYAIDVSEPKTFSHYDSSVNESLFYTMEDKKILESQSKEDRANREEQDEREKQYKNWLSDNEDVIEFIDDARLSSMKRVSRLYDAKTKFEYFITKLDVNVEKAKEVVTNEYWLTEEEQAAVFDDTLENH